MIKFFRKIRQKLLTENKISRYLIYAIGEIILVVVGILLALSINNWNNEQNRQKEEILILKEIAQNLQFDLEEFDRNYTYFRNLQLASKNLIHAIDKNSNYHDSLSFYLFFSGYSAHFSPNTSGYELLESKGLDLISNDSLRQKISETYSIWYPWMLKREGENRTYLFDNLHKLRNKYLGTKSLFKDSQPKSLEENFMVNVIVSSGNIRKMINYEEFKRDSEIHGLVKGAEVRFRLEHDVHLLVETGINDLIDLIQREIQNDVSQ